MGSFDVEIKKALAKARCMAILAALVVAYCSLVHLRIDVSVGLAVLPTTLVPVGLEILVVNGLYFKNRQGLRRNCRGGK